jgi:hypothetical protein
LQRKLKRFISLERPSLYKLSRNSNRKTRDSLTSCNPALEIAGVPPSGCAAPCGNLTDEPHIKPLLKATRKACGICSFLLAAQNAALDDESETVTAATLRTDLYKGNVYVVPVSMTNEFGNCPSSNGDRESAEKTDVGKTGTDKPDVPRERGIGNGS